MLFPNFLIVFYDCCVIIRLAQFFLLAIYSIPSPTVFTFLFSVVHSVFLLFFLSWPLQYFYFLNFFSLSRFPFFLCITFPNFCLFFFFFRFPLFFPSVFVFRVLSFFSISVSTFFFLHSLLLFLFLLSIFLLSSFQSSEAHPVSVTGAPAHNTLSATSRD